jgi:hypothetical protein
MRERKGTKIARKAKASSNVVSPMDEHTRAFIDRMLASRNADAREWLRGAPEGNNRTLGEMGSDLASEFVERLYKLGASKVLAVEIEDIPGTADQTTNHLLVELPQNPEARASLFEFENQHAEVEGFDGEVDLGQQYLYLKLC